MRLSLTRRCFVGLGIASPLLGLSADAKSAGGEAADWPIWAPPRSTLYDRIRTAAAREGKDIRGFGATLDGKSDDTAAMEKALASGARVIVIPGHKGSRMRLTRALAIDHEVLIVGVGGRPVISAENREQTLFTAALPGDDAKAFLQEIRFDNLTFERPEPRRAHGVALLGYNVRNVSVTRCSAIRMGLIEVNHVLQRQRRYLRSKGDNATDPAVLAGFSATNTDDLNEHVLVYDCTVDAKSHFCQLARLEFTRQVAVAHCQGRFACVSWWGGGGRRNQGGDLAFLRRARDIYVCDNVFSGAIGGIYGNNGQNILVARNHVSMVTDIGIDFEGCIDVLATGNTVENAGNYCYATLFAAKNVVFENNIAVQDGAATNIHERYGARKVGGVRGRTLFALRSAGFAGSTGAVDVAYRRNRFVWRGPDGVGSCLASYFDSLELTGNVLENVLCPMAYSSTQHLVVRENVLRFSRNDFTERPVLSGSGGDMTIAGNTIEASQPLPGAAIAIFAQLSERTRSVSVTNNRIKVAGAAAIEIAGHPSDPGTGAVTVNGNIGAAIRIPEGRVASVSGNRLADGTPAAVTRVPAASPAAS
ncbi:hypothetical protein PMI02_02620 [Novosphingobium sp. AP12]|nr:hypothetical protein PMI02_02620 [Novosphingobium sp. AP12]